MVDGGSFEMNVQPGNGEVADVETKRSREPTLVGLISETIARVDEIGGVNKQEKVTVVQLVGSEGDQTQAGLATGAPGVMSAEVTQVHFRVFSPENRYSQFLRLLVNTQEQVLGLFGWDSLKRKTEIYMKVYEDYRRLLIQNGLKNEDDPEDAMERYCNLLQRISNGGNVDDVLEEKRPLLENSVKELGRAFVDELARPLMLLETRFYRKQEAYETQVVERLGLSRENYTRGSVLVRLMQMRPRDRKKFIEDLSWEVLTPIDSGSWDQFRRRSMLEKEMRRVIWEEYALVNPKDEVSIEELVGLGRDSMMEVMMDDELMGDGDEYSLDEVSREVLLSRLGFDAEPEDRTEVVRRYEEYGQIKSFPGDPYDADEVMAWYRETGSKFGCPAGMENFRQVLKWYFERMKVKKASLNREVASSRYPVSEADESYASAREAFVRSLNNSVTKAKLMALSMYDKYHWREFLKRMMHEGLSREEVMAAKFTGEVVAYDETGNPDFLNDLIDALEDALDAGTAYEFSTMQHKEKSDGVWEVVQGWIPACVPLYMRSEKKGGERKGEMRPDYPVRITVKAKLLGEESGSFEQNSTAEGAGVLLDYEEREGRGPGDIAGFLNNEENLKIKAEMAHAGIPLYVKVIRYQDGKVCISAISDHTVMDGVPMCNDVIARVVEYLGLQTDVEMLPESMRQALGTKRELEEAKGIIPEAGQLKDLEKMTELTVMLPVEAINGFRKLLKDASKKGIRIVDHTGVDYDISKFGLGMLLTQYGHMASKLAQQKSIVTGMGQRAVGSLAFYKDIEQQLGQVLISDLKLPDDMSEWFSIEEEEGVKRIKLSQSFVTTIETLGEVYQKRGGQRDAMQVVRGVFNLPEVLWRFNAFMSGKVLAPFGSETVGKVMISTIRNLSKVIGGPALVRKWQNLAMTMTQMESGYMATKVKLAGDMVKVGDFLRDFVEKVYYWERGRDGQEGNLAKVERARVELGL